VLTVEHLLSALTGLGITDAAVEVYGPEVPIGDGSAAFIAGALRRAGVRPLGESVEPMVLRREVAVGTGSGGRIVARPRPEPGCSYTYELDYGPGAPLAPQRASWIQDGATQDSGLRDSGPPDSGLSRSARLYLSDIAPARTFCLQKEAEQMRAAGMFKDLSPGEMLVIGEHGPIENEYRFENEPARHKLLDLIGDLALVGRPIQAEIIATRAGHALNQELARVLAGLS
jgi:UDP-3-O-acyl-N-acetylglucosamine deacetylase